MVWHSLGLHPAFVTAVRSGLDAFVQLQRLRFSAYSDALGSHTTTHGLSCLAVSTSSDTATFPQTLCGWSDLFLSRLKAVGEEVVLGESVEVVWELVSVILGILEGGGGDDDCLVNTPYVEWYRTCFVQPAAVEKICGTLRSLSSESKEALTDIAGTCMVAIQRAFLAGLFSVSANLISAYMSFLRTSDTDAFSAEEERALSEVVRFLLRSPEEGMTHDEWSENANTLVFDCKRVLQGNGATGAFAQAAQQLKSLCLDLVLMANGDAALILQTCYLLELDVTDYVAAVCVVCGTPMTLRQLHHLFRTTLESWEGATRGPWYVSVLERLFGCCCVADVVGVMQLVVEMVRSNKHIQLSGRPSDSSDVVLSPRSSIDTTGDDEGISDVDYHSMCPNAVTMNNGTHLGGDSDNAAYTIESRRFALLFMAAHVADICAPPLGAPADQISVTFVRNELIAGYISLFRGHPLLWRAAATYVVYSPLADPTALYRIVTGQAADAVRDRYTSLSLYTFIHTSWEENSAFQVALRRLLHDKYPSSDSVNKWIRSLDFYRRKAVEVLNGEIINERMACGDVASAVWLAVETQQCKSVQVRVEGVLRSPEALRSTEVYCIGQAVSNSFISVDGCLNLRMLHVLRTCAALSEYRKACATLEHSTMKPTGDALEAECQQRVLRAADKVLHRISLLRIHPTSVLSIVEQTIGVALRVPRERRSKCLLPLLTNALEQLFTAESVNSREYAGCAASIREKLMGLL
ncbi:hypothetical protein ERJ75_000769800 [Trypanosoma vivax]|uniref:Nuclear pore complex protein n=1 Tax=Trypanosoma vivax (strain Y486) TaxID=1055687 RepID=G0U3N7_TRYVY|nr:hypothetical protein TRVL_04958 [Trypanosoma vivax]KAH8614165.1 hypothetical protein ERJ75_000769800 [Trypanosoma vivax]CCC50894.1 putative conserved hypothetical protein [Trypanosoma vivax Y486]